MGCICPFSGFKKERLLHLPAERYRGATQVFLGFYFHTHSLLQKKIQILNLIGGGKRASPSTTACSFLPSCFPSEALATQKTKYKDQKDQQESPGNTMLSVNTHLFCMVPLFQANGTVASGELACCQAKLSGCSSLLDRKRQHD